MNQIIALALACMAALVSTCWAIGDPHLGHGIGLGLGLHHLGLGHIGPLHDGVIVSEHGHGLISETHHHGFPHIFDNVHGIIGEGAHRYGYHQGLHGVHGLHHKIPHHNTFAHRKGLAHAGFGHGHHGEIGGAHVFHGVGHHGDPDGFGHNIDRRLGSFNTHRLHLSHSGHIHGPHPSFRHRVSQLGLLHNHGQTGHFFHSHDFSSGQSGHLHPVHGLGLVAN